VEKEEQEHQAENDDGKNRYVSISILPHPYCSNPYCSMDYFLSTLSFPTSILYSMDYLFLHFLKSDTMYYMTASAVEMKQKDKNIRQRTMMEKTGTCPFLFFPHPYCSMDYFF